MLDCRRSLDRNTFGLFGFLERRIELGTPVGTAASIGDTGNDTSGGVNLSWSRSLTPRLSSNATVGYARDNLQQSEHIDSQFKYGVFTG